MLFIQLIYSCIHGIMVVSMAKLFHLLHKSLAEPDNSSFHRDEGVVQHLMRTLQSTTMHCAGLVPIETHITQCPKQRFCMSHLSFSVKLDVQKKCKDKALIHHGLQNDHRVIKVYLMPCEGLVCSFSTPL